MLGRIGQLANRIEQIQQRLRLLGMGEAAVPGLDFAAWLQQATLQDSAGQAAASAGLPQLAGSSSPQLTTGGRFDDMIAQVAARHGLDPDLLHAIVKVESDYNPRCVSSAGAKGLMQLMPGTARYLGVEDIFDPQQNLEGGARYLKEQLERFGDPVLALAAYNAGPGAVAQYHGVPPYEETQAYVPRVLEYYRARRVASQQPAAGTTPTTHPATDANASSAPPRASLRPDADAVAAAQSVSTAPSRDLVQQPARRNAQVPSEPQRLKPAPSQPLNPLAEGVSTELTADSAVVKLAARPADIPQPTSAAIAKAPVLLVGQASRLSPVPLTEPAQPAVPTAQVADAEPAVVISRDAPTATVVKPPQTAPEASPPQTESTAIAKAPVLLVGQASRLSPVPLTEPAQATGPISRPGNTETTVASTGDAPTATVVKPPQTAPEASPPQTESTATAKAPVLLVGQASRLSPVPLTEPAQATGPISRPGNTETAVASTGDAPTATVVKPPQTAPEASPPQTESTASAKAPVLLVGQASRLSPVPLTEPAQPAVPTAQVADAEPAVVISRDAPTATVVKPPQTAPEASPPQTESTASAKAPVLLVGQASRLSPVTLTEPAQPAAPTVQLADAKAAVGVTDAAPRMAVATLPHIGRGASLPQAESAASAKAPVLLVGQASRLSPVPLTEPAQPAAPTVQLADAKAAVGVTDAAPRMAVATLPHIGRGASPPQTESTARAEAPATAAKSAQVTATIAGAEPPRQPAQQPAVGVPAPGLLIGSELAAALEQRLSELVAAGADRLRLAEAVTLPRQEITIELAPPELGRVQIAFELEHEAASVEVRTETFSTAAHLESSFRGLATSLEQLGLKLASLKVSCDAGGFGPNHEGTGQSASWQQQASAGWQALGAGGAGQNAGSGGEAFTFAETAHIPGGDETTPIGQRPAHFTSGLQRSRPARLVSVLDVAA